MKTLLVLQALLTFQVDGDGPVRFGFPLRAGDLTHGLRVDRAAARLQWRPLQARPDPTTGRVWVELAVAGVRGRAAIVAGGAGPREPRQGDLVRLQTDTRAEIGRDVRSWSWRWAGGERDLVERATFRQATPLGGEECRPGESHTTLSAGTLERCMRVRIAPRTWAAAGVLPALGPRARRWREHLVAAAEHMQTLPGPRGRGDYGRSGGIVTNLEFDTALALLRLGLAQARPDLVQRGIESARHSIDHDLDPVSGLPCRHGSDHRAVPPEPGHAWLSGILLAGCLTADDGLIAAARSIALGIARHPARAAERWQERARDFAWPLLELETWLRFATDPTCERAADVLAEEILGRWDAGNGVVRFGEGEVGRGVYDERVWLTGGMLLPALRAHRDRRPSKPIDAIIEALQRRIGALVREGRKGIPLRYRVRNREIWGQVRATQRAAGFFVLEGLTPRDLRRALARDTVTRALHGVPATDDPDLATNFTIAARCAWIFQ